MIGHTVIGEKSTTGWCDHGFNPVLDCFPITAMFYSSYTITLYLLMNDTSCFVTV